MITKQRLCVRVYIVLSSFVCKSDLLSRMALNDFSVIINHDTAIYCTIQQKPTATFRDNSQGYDSFKDLALIRDILSRACGRAFKHTTIAMGFISDKSFNKVMQSTSRKIIIVLTTD